MADRETRQRLTSAVNDLAQFVMENLPEGWTIQLDLTSEEAGLSLFNPDGDEIEACADDEDPVVACCEEAQRIESGEDAY